MDADPVNRESINEFGIVMKGLAFESFSNQENDPFSNHLIQVILILLIE